MKRIELIINEDGSYSIEMMEGFVGQSCAQKTQNIITLLQIKRITPNKNIKL